MSAKRSKPRKTVSVSGTSSAKLREPRKKKKSRSKAANDRPFEVVTMTEEQRQELDLWLRLEDQDPSFKKVDPVKVNHAVLTFMAQVAMVKKLNLADVERTTQVTRQHQRKLRPHVNVLDDVHVALVNLLKWGMGLHLNPAHVLDRVLKQLTAFGVMLLPVGG